MGTTNKSQAQLDYEAKYETTPGRYLCTIESVDVSPKNAWGFSHIMVNMTSQNGKSVRAKIDIPRDNDHPKSKEFKDKFRNDFLKNSGADTENKKGKDLLNDLVGRKVRCMFRDVEYIGKDKVGKPMKKTYLGLWYTGKAEEEMDALDAPNSLKKLNDYETKKLTDLLADWNTGPNSNQAPQEEDDLPF